jgi:hypothetical protein
MTFTLTKKICPICGKEYIPATMHVYKVDLIKPYKKSPVCSWKCVMEGERQAEQMRQRRKKVL